MICTVCKTDWLSNATTLCPVCYQHILPLYIEECRKQAARYLQSVETVQSVVTILKQPGAKSEVRDMADYRVPPVILSAKDVEPDNMPILKPEPSLSGVGMPASLWLDVFGGYVWDAFGSIPYLVGSALTGTKGEFRDVDVRLILSDSDYAKVIGEWNRNEHRNPRWVSLCLAYSLLGKQLTGLPIDFQIQQQTEANKRFTGVRSAIGITGHRINRLDKPKAEPLQPICCGGRGCVSCETNGEKA